MFTRCSRRIISIEHRKRLFRIFNRDTPYIVEIKYDILNPSFFGPTEEIARWNVIDPKEFIEEIKNGKCMACGDITKCGRKQYHFMYDKEKN